MSEGMKKACLQSMCPKELSDHIDLNCTRLSTYAELKMEIERYVDQVLAKKNATAMDLNYVGPSGTSWKSWKFGQKTRKGGGKGTGGRMF